MENSSRQIYLRNRQPKASQIRVPQNFVESPITAAGFHGLDHIVRPVFVQPVFVQSISSNPVRLG